MGEECCISYGENFVGRLGFVDEDDGGGEGEGEGEEMGGLGEVDKVFGGLSLGLDEE